MTPLFLFRLFLDFLAVSLLLAAMAYNWSGNILHEIMGTAMFLLLVLHNVFNRRWYGTIAKSRSEARSTITKVLNLSLLISMLSLLVTSVVISQAVFQFMALTSTFTARQIHSAVAYLVLLIAAGHLGLHWTLIMGVVRSQLGIASKSKARAIILRSLATLGSACGIFSMLEVNVAQKLMMQMSFEFGDLQTPTLLLILQHVAIVWLVACIAHYALVTIQHFKENHPASG